MNEFQWLKYIGRHKNDSPVNTDDRTEIEIRNKAGVKRIDPRAVDWTTVIEWRPVQ